MDREMAAQQEVAVLGHRDSHEVTRPGPLSDLGRDEGE
jgi:hypothetical protein